MMNKIFLSLLENHPDGFEFRTPSSEELESCFICLISDSLESFRHNCGNMESSAKGIIISAGKKTSCQRIGSMLWHLESTDLSGISREMAGLLLDSLCSGKNNALSECLSSLSDSAKEMEEILEEKNLILNAEKAARESEEKYRSIFNATNEAIFIHDVATGRILDVNHGMLKMFGYSYEEAIKCDIGILSENIPPYTQREAVNNLKTALSQGPQIFYWNSRRKNGDLFFSEVSLRKARIGSSEKIIAVVRDISDRKKTESALKKSEQLFRGYFELGLIGMSTTTPERKWIHFNDQLCKMLGYPRDELAKLTWDDVTHPGSMEAENENYRLMMAGETNGYNMDKRYIRKDGSTLYVNISVNCHRNEKKEIEYIIAMVQDISERKKAEKALRKSEALLYATIESLPFDIFAIDEDGRYMLQNSASRNLWGNVKGKTTKETNVAQDIKSQWMENNKKAFEGKQIMEEVVYTINGSKKEFYQIIVPIFKEAPGKGIVGVNIDITELKKAQEALSENEERLRTLINSMPDIICFKDGEGRWIEANDFYLKLFGLEGVEYRGKKNTELAGHADFYKDTIRVRDDSDEKTWASGVTTRKDEIIPKPDGSFLIFDNIKIPMFYPDGRRRGIIKVGRDITERKKIEDALIRTRHNFEAFFGTVNDLIFILDEEGRIIHINDAVTRRLGYTDEGLKGSLVSMILAPNPDKETKIPSLSDFKGETNRDGIPLVAKNGQVIEVETATFRGEWDGLPALFRISRDISDLKLSEKKFSTAFNSNSAVMAISTVKEGKYLDVNETFLNLSGYTREEVIGQKSTDLKIFEDPDNREKIKEIFHKNGKVRDFEAKLRKKNGEIIYGLLAIDRFNLGDEPCWLTVLTDLTERKKAEAEKLEMERRLLHAQKLESLGVLAGGIAHDFNNLLTGILGNLDLAILSLPAGSSATSRIEQAIQASYRAVDLTRQMLAYSGKGKFEIKPVDIERIVRENADLFRASIARTVTFNISPGKGLPLVEADPGQIQQIIMNLITNASEAIGNSTGVISVTTGLMECDTEYLKASKLEEKPEPGKFVFAEVTDNGCGMDEETLNRLFEPFFTTKFTGRGLGMAAVLGIIRGHKGAILVDSEKGEGSTFRVLFPVIESIQKTDMASSISDGNTDKNTKKSGVILVVDDEDPVRELCADFLNVFGFETLSACDGNEAVKIFREHHNEIICVILDLTMPGLDGAGTFRELKNIRKDIRIILSSGYSEHEATVLFAGQGLSGFIQKPYRLADLKDKLDQVMKNDGL